MYVNLYTKARRIAGPGIELLNFVCTSSKDGELLPRFVVRHDTPFEVFLIVGYDGLDHHSGTGGGRFVPVISLGLCRIRGLLVAADERDQTGRRPVHDHVLVSTVIEDDCIDCPPIIALDVATGDV